MSYRAIIYKGVDDLMSHKYDTLPWHYAISTAEKNSLITAYTFGPLVKTVTRIAGQVQARVRYYDHNAKFYKSEAALIAHMDYLARKGN